MRVCVVTPWYPDRVHPFSGVFVRQQVDALRRAGATVEVEVLMLHPAPPATDLGPAHAAIEKIAAHSPRSVYGDEPLTSVIPTLTSPAIGYAGRAEAFRHALAGKRRVRPVEADIVHAHVGLPAAHAALGVGDTTPVAVTEHFTGLGRLLRQGDAAQMYQRVIERAAYLATVSNSLRSVIGERFGADVESAVETIPNIVDLTDVPFRDDRAGSVDSWLYVGNLTDVKNVELLLRSFDRFHQSSTTATLTIVGQGPKQEWIEEYIERHGLGDAVVLVGGLDHAELGTHFAAADLYVHLSTVETFGISTMEAIGAGLPVINLDNGAAREVWGEIVPIAGEILGAHASAEDVCDAADRLRRSSTLDPHSARRYVTDQFSPESIANRLLDVYRSIL